MHVRSLTLSATMAALCLAPVAANAATVTSNTYLSYSVGLNGVSKAGSTPNSRFGYVGGNATTSTGSTTFPSFEVYEIDGSSVLSQFRTTTGNATATLTAINSLSLQLYGEATTTDVAGGFNFAYATAAAALGTGNSTPVYDPSAIGGLTTQLGATIGLGTGSYTPVAVTNNPLSPYALGSTLGNAAILSDINAGAHFYLVVSATTATTKATIDGYFGLAPFITAPTLTIDATATPEPATLGLAGVAAAGLLRRRRA